MSLRFRRRTDSVPARTQKDMQRQWRTTMTSKSQCVPHCFAPATGYVVMVVALCFLFTGCDDDNSENLNNISVAGIGHLYSGQQAQSTVSVAPNSTYVVNVTYSNDGGSDSVSILVDGIVIGTFSSVDTFVSGQRGDGWYQYQDSPSYPLNTDARQTVSVGVRVNGGDEYGFRVAAIRLNRAAD